MLKSSMYLNPPQVLEGSEKHFMISQKEKMEINIAFFNEVNMAIIKCFPTPEVNEIKSVNKRPTNVTPRV